MTDSIIPLRFMALSQLLISLPLPLMIVPAKTKYYDIPLISFQLPFFFSGDSVSTLATPYDSLQVLLLNDNIPYTKHY